MKVTKGGAQMSGAGALSPTVVIRGLAADVPRLPVSSADEHRTVSSALALVEEALETALPDAPLVASMHLTERVSDALSAATEEEGWADRLRARWLLQPARPLLAEGLEPHLVTASSAPDDVVAFLALLGSTDGERRSARLLADAAATHAAAFAGTVALRAGHDPDAPEESAPSVGRPAALRIWARLGCFHALRALAALGDGCDPALRSLTEHLGSVEAIRDALAAALLDGTIGERDRERLAAALATRRPAPAVVPAPATRSLGLEPRESLAVDGLTVDPGEPFPWEPDLAAALFDDGLTEPPRAVVQLLDAGRFDGAGRLLDHLASEDPDAVELAYLRGVLAYRSHDLDRAHLVFADLVERRPDLAMPRYGLGLVHLQRGHRPEAVDCFEYVVALEPAFRPAWDRLRALGVAGPDQPPQPGPTARVTRPPDLRVLVPVWQRATRLTLLVLVVLGTLYASVLALTASWAVVTEPGGSDQHRAILLGLGAGAAAVGLSIALLGIDQVGSVTVRGVVSAVSTREERVGRARRPRLVLDVTLCPVDRHRHRFPQLPVELRTRSLHGTIEAGDTVEATGRPTRDNYLAARMLRSETTGLVVRR